MPRQIRTSYLVAAGLCLAYSGILISASTAFASDDAVRNTMARKDCGRGKFKDYYLQGQGGDPSADYKGRVFKLSQDYPTQLPPKEAYPWLKIAFKDGGPVDPRAYLQALLDYGLEGNVDVDFYVQDNKVRKWDGMPLMDWNTEVASDWPGTDGREFVHGLTHEFDSEGNTFGVAQKEFVDTWAQAYVNDRYAFSVGQVYCNLAERKLGKVRLIQIDLQVRDNGSTTGWLLGTYGYDGRAKGDTPWKRMVPLGIQWGNNPTVTFAQTCSGPNGPCDYDKLTEQWINRQAVKDLATPPLSFNHLGFGGRLAGPVDNPKSSCMGCHQTAGFPTVPILAEFAPNGALLKLDAQTHPETAQSLRMMYFGNVLGGAVFSDTQLYSTDYSLQLSMGLQNFVSLRCAKDASPPRPSLCDQLVAWAELQKKGTSGVLVFGTPGHGGAPLKSQ